MNKHDLKIIAHGFIETFLKAGEESINLFNKGLKIEIKDDNSPVTNGDLSVNKIISEQIIKLTPNIPIISEETVDIKVKNKFKVFWVYVVDISKVIVDIIFFRYQF